MKSIKEFIQGSKSFFKVLFKYHFDLAFWICGLIIVSILPGYLESNVFYILFTIYIPVTFFVKFSMESDIEDKNRDIRKRFEYHLGKEKVDKVGGQGGGEDREEGKIQKDK